jgi:hypothetical protein
MTMTETPLTGRCLCGAVRYRAGAPLYPPTLCHCESCRRAAGAHVVAWLTVRADSFAYTATAPLRYASSPGVLREFCGRCGTPLTYRAARRADEVDIGLATLDAAARFAPADHIWMEDALPWDRPGDGLPQYPRGRPA